jgi:hypothetical protein
MDGRVAGLLMELVAWEEHEGVGSYFGPTGFAWPYRWLCERASPAAMRKRRGIVPAWGPGRLTSILKTPDPFCFSFYGSREAQR